MGRDYRFDVARVVCMTYIVAFVHLYAYIYPNVISANVIPACAILCDACLGLFTFISGYLLGKKYSFGEQGKITVGNFYKKRIIRIIPLFVVSAVALWLIHFNGTRATINGLLCISPFVTPRPMTLWYIPVILLCYCITPIISRKTLRSRVRNCLLVFALLLGISKLVPKTDSRLLFNAFFYMVGVISAACFDWKFNCRHGTLAKLLISVLFLILLCLGQLYANFHQNAYRTVVAGIGMFPLLFISEYISKYFFGSDNNIRNGWKGKICRLISLVSYASMACYMFHRLFFWAGEKIYNPGVAGIKWVYMAGLVFPVILYLSYLIQKYYDSLVNCYFKRG